MEHRDWTPLPPYPEPEEYARFFWEYAKRHQLAIQRCDHCGRYQHWPTPVCRNCSSFSLSPAVVSGQGTLYTFTVATQSFHPYFDDKIPLIIGVVELEEQEGLKLVANLVDCRQEEITIGMPVQVVFRDVTEDLTLPQFAPARIRT
jgi:uncharacterized OB-fold protein